MKIDEHLTNRLNQLKAETDNPDRIAEINNLLCAVSESRQSLRCAIDLYKRVTELEENPDSAGKHDDIRSALKFCLETDEADDSVTHDFDVEVLI